MYFFDEKCCEKNHFGEETNMAFEKLRWVILLVCLLKISYLHLSKIVAPPDFGRSVIPISNRRSTTTLTLAPLNFQTFLRPLITYHNFNKAKVAWWQEKRKIIPPWKKCLKVNNRNFEIGSVMKSVVDFREMTAIFLFF